MRCFGISILLLLRTVGNQVRQTSRHVAFVNDSLQSTIVSIVVVSVFSSRRSCNLWYFEKLFPVEKVPDEIRSHCKQDENSPNAGVGSWHAHIPQHH